MSVLDRIDYAAIRAHPKPFLGFSDITLYHLAFFARCGLVGFHADTLTDGLGGRGRSSTSTAAPTSWASTATC